LARINYEKVQLKYYLAFSPYALAYKLDTTIEELPKKVEEYVNKNPNLKKSPKKPSCYMLGEYHILDKKPKAVYDMEFCEDLDLLILVMCSTVDDLYIPNRELSFEEGKFDKVLYFPKDEVER
jgi:hypothetical protein